MTRKAQKIIPSDKQKKVLKPRSPKQIAAQFKKGNKANPLGGLAHDPFKRQVKQLTSHALAEITSMVCEMSVAEVEQLLNGPDKKKLTIAQTTILRSALDAAEDGAIEKFNIIVSRVIGNIATVVDVKSSDGSMSPSKLPNNMTPEQIKEKEEELRNAINQKLDQIEATKS